MKDRNGKMARPPRPGARKLHGELMEAAEQVTALTNACQTYERQLELAGRFMTVLVEREVERNGRCVITKAELERAPTMWDGVRHEAPEGEERVVLHLVPLPEPGASAPDEEQPAPEPSAADVAETKAGRLH